MIQKVSLVTKNEVMKKSVYNLPDRPSEAGISSSDIKKAFYIPILDDENSVFSELDRIITATNSELNSLSERITLMETNLNSLLETANSSLATSTENALWVDSAKTTIRQLGEEIETLKSRCTALESDN